jgi:hypothetical protein
LVSKKILIINFSNIVLNVVGYVINCCQNKISRPKPNIK